MSQNTSGLSNAQQAFLIALAATLTSLGSIVSALGAVQNSQLQLIVGIIVAVCGVAAFFIKEYLGALGVNVPSNVQAKQ